MAGGFISDRLISSKDLHISSIEKGMLQTNFATLSSVNFYHARESGLNSIHYQV